MAQIAKFTLFKFVFPSILSCSVKWVSFIHSFIHSLPLFVKNVFFQKNKTKSLAAITWIPLIQRPLKEEMKLQTEENNVWQSLGPPRTSGNPKRWRTSFVYTITVSFSHPKRMQIIHDPQAALAASVVGRQASWWAAHSCCRHPPVLKTYLLPHSVAASEPSPGPRQQVLGVPSPPSLSPLFSARVLVQIGDHWSRSSQGKKAFKEAWWPVSSCSCCLFGESCCVLRKRWSVLGLVERV